MVYEETRKLDAHGKITIPLKLRRKLGIRAGDRFDVYEANGQSNPSYDKLLKLRIFERRSKVHRRLLTAEQI